MKSGQTNNKQGFTIIEVLMVLGIAGLIFAIVFTALPRARISSRDGERKQALSTILSEVEQYGANNRGKYPVNGTGLRTIVNANLDGANFRDPKNKTTYSSRIYNNNAGFTVTLPDTAGAEGTIIYAVGAECDPTPAGNDYLDGTGFSRTYAAVIRLERGAYCQDSK